MQKTTGGIDGVLRDLLNLLMSPVQKEKIFKIILDLRFFCKHSVDTDVLQTRKLQTELLMFGPTLLRR